MDNQLHIHILDVLQQGNAIANLVDIKPAFTHELDTQEKRKHFKTQLEYLVAQNLIETNSKFEFLGWELLTGLYPLDNKKIEARLTGNWETYLANKRSNYKREAPILPPPAAKTNLFDSPAYVLSYPGVNREVPPPPAPPAQKTTISAKVRRDDDNDDGFMPFKTKAKQKPDASANADNYLKEEDFLPSKSRNTTTPQQPAAPQSGPNVLNHDGEQLFTSIFSSRHKPYTTPAPTQEPGPIGREPIFGADASYTPPRPADNNEPQAFSNQHTSYTPPPNNTLPDVAVHVTPFSPAASPQPTIEPQQTPPPRISATVKRNQVPDDEVPIITARSAGLRARAQTTPAQTPPEQAPVKETPPANRVVNLSSSAPAPVSRPAEPLHRTPVPGPASPVAPIARTPIVPPGHSSIHFDTENNPFNSLGTITLSNNQEKRTTSINWATIIKWTVISVISLIIIIAIVMYKKRYS